MNIKSKKPFLALFLIIISYTFVSISYFCVSKMIKEDCLNRLFSYVIFTEDSVNAIFEDNYNALESIAEYLAENDLYESPEGFNMFESFSPLIKSDRIHLLLPNGDVFNNSGERRNIAGRISFTEESIKGRHISSRINSIINPGEKIIRQFVPVIKNGRTVAILYATIACENFDRLVNTDVIGYENCHFFVVERNTGNFIYDSKHENLGNVVDYRNRSIPNDIAYYEVTDAINEGKRGCKKVFSDSGKGCNYMAYIPSLINDWSFVISVPETQITQKLRYYHIQLFIFCLSVLILFIVYLYFCHRENVNNTKTAEAIHNGLMKQNEEIIAALSNEYGSVFYINLDANSIIPYRMNKADSIKLNERTGNRTATYEEFVSMYTTYCVSERDKEDVLYSCSIENLKFNLVRRKSLTVKYESVNGKYYEMKFSTGDCMDNQLKSVVLGIAEKDYEIRKELKENLKKQQN